MALGYREHAAEFTERNVVLFGIHDGSLDAARQWVEKEQLPFAVLNDPDRRVGIELGMSALDGERYVKDPSDGKKARSCHRRTQCDLRVGIRHEPHRSDCKVTGAFVGRPQRCGLFDCCPPLCSRQNGVQLGLWLSRPISKGAELEREAQPVVPPAPHPDMLDVVVGQRVMAQQGGFVRGQVEQRRALARAPDA